MSSIVIDNNIINEFQNSGTNFDLFCKKIKAKNYEIFLPQVIFQETAGRLANKREPAEERLKIIKELNNRCNLKIMQESGHIIKNELNKKGEVKRPLFMPEDEKNKILAVPCLGEDIRQNDEKSHQIYIQNNNDGYELSELIDLLDKDPSKVQKWYNKKTKPFCKNHPEDKHQEIYDLFLEEGFTTDSSNKSIYLDFIKYTFEQFEHYQKIDHKTAVAKKILNERNSYKYLRGFLSLLFCQDFKWHKKDSEIKSDPKKNRDKFKKEADQHPQGCINDLFYAAFSSYSKFFITNDKKLQNRCNQLYRILAFKTISLNDFLKI